MAVAAAFAQIGTTNIGTVTLGIVKTGAPKSPGESTLPVCTVSNPSCSPVPYIFIGNGYWSDATNWLGNVVPPQVLPAGRTITIYPAADGECVLNLPQTIADGAYLNIVPQKKLRVLSALLFLK